MGSIYEFAKQQRDDYRSRTIQIADGYEFSQYKTFRAIELYHNSRFPSGNKDSLGREKPFYNVTKFRVNFATCATDIDTKNVRVVSDAADRKTPHFILNLRNRNWMEQNAFAVFVMGSALLAEDIVAEDLANGRLRRGLPDWHASPIFVYAVTETRLLPPKTRRFVEFLSERLKRA